MEGFIIGLLLGAAIGISSVAMVFGLIAVVLAAW